MNDRVRTMAPHSYRGSARMAGVQSPIIPVVGDLIRAHPGTISLGQGVVHYGPPRQAYDCMAGFFDDPDNHKYRGVDGVQPLRAAIETKLAADNGVNSAGATGGGGDTRIIVTAGANMAFMNAILAITDPGDEVIIQHPYYFNHEMAIRIADCTPVAAPTTADHQLDLAAIEPRITDRTRAIVTISPNNPSGAVYAECDLRAVNELCRRRGLYHISDEAYEYFVYGQAEHVSPASFEDSREHTISLYSLSKAYGFASWRIGYMVIPAHLETAVRKIQDTILICPPVISQYAAIGALEAGSAYCRGFVSELAQVRELVLGELAGLGSLCRVPQPQGAFYVLIELDTKHSDMTIVERLVREHGVAAIPGQTFGIDDRCCLRIAYGALEKETVAEGIGRLTRGLRAIIGG